jgi:energy-coupling factor transporter ATP-binding protein EcfA2
LDEYLKYFIYPKKIKLITDIELKNNLKKNKKCNNELCDHKKYIGEEETDWYNTNEIIIQSVETVRDLIKLGKLYHCMMRRNFNGIDLKLLFEIKEYLEELDKLIGLNNIKEEIVNLIIHLLLMMDNNNISNISGSGVNKINRDMLHCVITGSPGCGKTTFIEIYAKILTKLGVSKSGHIVKVKRSDLIGKYLGHTAVQTQKKIDEAKGGILLIDEAYSLGNPDKSDSFSKECLDTLNQALSENKQDFICIIAGYANALDSSFFAYNEGLRRRFPFRFDIQPYTSKELTLILEKKIKEYGVYDIQYKLDELSKIIKKNFFHFKNQGGDMETLFLNIKINHNKRIFLLPVEEKKKLFIYDIKTSIDKFIKLKGIDKQNNNLSNLYI